MRAHFANDVPASPDTEDGLQQDSFINTKEPQPKVAKNLSQDRILEFKSDSTKMTVVGEFIDDVLQKAEEEANKQQIDKNKNSQQVCVTHFQKNLRKNSSEQNVFLLLQGKNKTQKQSKFYLIKKNF